MVFRVQGEGFHKQDFFFVILMMSSLIFYISEIYLGEAMRAVSKNKARKNKFKKNHYNFLVFTDTHTKKIRIGQKSQKIFKIFFG
jgi:hypothetical protein